MYQGGTGHNRLLREHKNSLGKRTASNISKARASVRENVIRVYFDNLSVTLDSNPETHIFNYNEINVSDDPGKMKVLYR